MSNSLDPDQARHFVGLDLGPTCLQRLSADNTSRQRVRACFENVNNNSQPIAAPDLKFFFIFSVGPLFIVRGFKLIVTIFLKNRFH